MVDSLLREDVRVVIEDARERRVGRMCLVCEKRASLVEAGMDASDGEEFVNREEIEVVDVDGEGGEGVLAMCR